MRPTVKFLSTHLIEQIISEAKQILSKLGITIENDKILSMLSDNGAKVDFTNHQVLFSNQLIDKCLKTVPDSFKLYDVNGNMTNDFCGYNVHFTPGSSALNILDYKTNSLFPVTTNHSINRVPRVYYNMLYFRHSLSDMKRLP